MPAALLVGASVIGGVAQYQSAKRGAKAATNAANQATQLQREQFERGVQEVAPFKELGINALPALSAAANQPVDQFNYRDQNQFLNDYFRSSEYNTLNNQATDQILRNRSATGGLRSGGANVDLGNIAPTLGINALSRVNQQDLQQFGVNQGAKTDQFNRLYSVGSLGANVASGNQVAGANFASQAGANAITAGNAQANAYVQQGQAINGVVSGIGTAALGSNMNLFGNGGGGGGTGSTQGGYTGPAYQNWVAQQGGRP